MLIDKQNLPLVAMDFMNTTHLEDADLINKLYDAVCDVEKGGANETLKKTYEEWFMHTINHFKKEEEEMQAKAFPPFIIHKGEHDRVLARMQDVFQSWQDSGNIDELKSFVAKENLEWLINHINTMDTMTAMFLSSH